MSEGAPAPSPPGGRRRRPLRRLVVALLVAAFGAAAAGAGEEAPPPGERAALELSVLSYNTHGLPGWAVDDAPAERTPRIAARLGRYDLALLQEDFAHHARIRAGTKHPVALRGNASRFGGLCPVCAGAGLTLLARPPAAVRAVERVPYEVCSGWLRSGTDCLATKGLLRARLALPNGASLDVVNTHLDAGRGEADRSARAQQLARLRAHLERAAAGRALVVAGDFNLDAAEPADAALLERFRRALGLRDSGARARPEGPWRRIDHLFYRSGAGARIEVLEAGEDEGFAHEGAPLSDHPALFARLRVRPVRTGP